MMRDAFEGRNHHPFNGFYKGAGFLKDLLCLLLRFPWILLLLAAGVLALVAAAGAWLVQRAADRADVAEVMRLAA